MVRDTCGHSLLRAGVLRHGFGSFRDGVLSQLSGQKEPDGSLDLPRGDGGPLVVVSELAGLSSNPLEKIVDKGVHDTHGLGRDSGVRMDLLQHLQKQVKPISITAVSPCRCR